MKNKQLEDILEGYHLEQYGLPEVRKKLLLLFKQYASQQSVGEAIKKEIEKAKPLVSTSNHEGAYIRGLEFALSQYEPAKE